MGLEIVTVLRVFIVCVCVQQQVERRNGWINVGDLQGAVHFKIVKYERIKFLVIALKDSIEIYAWAPKPYHKFMAFKVGERELWVAFDRTWTNRAVRLCRVSAICRIGRCSSI